MKCIRNYFDLKLSNSVFVKKIHSVFVKKNTFWRFYRNLLCNKFTGENKIKCIPKMSRLSDHNNKVINAGG